MSHKLSYAQSLDVALPAGWVWSTLGEVADVLAGNPAPQGDEFFADGKYPFVRVQDMGRLSGATRINTTKDYINDKAVKGLRLFPKGSVLFTKSGASTLLNQRAMLGSDMYVVSHIAAAIPKAGVLSEWLYYWLRTVDFAYLAHATTLPSLPLSKAKAIPVPVAPIDQQKHIVAEIEKQFSRLDEAVANLKRVKANLKRYKAAVLKAAVEGRLVETEAELARKKIPSPLAGEGGGEGAGYETGAQLLQRILETRRSQWKGKGKYKEPAAPDTTDLPEVPKGWVWASLDQLTSDSLIGLDRGRDQQNSEGVGVPYVKMNNVTMEGDVTDVDMVYVNASGEEKRRFSLERDDLLFNTRNSKELVGKVGLVRVIPKDSIYNNNLLRIRLADGAIPSFVCSQMCSDGFRRRMEHVKKATTNVAAVYAKDLFPLQLAFPPEQEQRRIVAEIDRRLSLVRETEAQVDANIKRSERLRQAILSVAFGARGRG